jgi:excinuclease ABC subunit A
VLLQAQQRVKCLQQVGLGYLALNRTLRTLSSGEAQRVLLTTALGSSLVNVLYVLDEPSAGLHAFDVIKLIDALRHLTLRGNTVVVVEHDAALLKSVDHLIEIGPRAGERGGKVVCAGTPIEVTHSEHSLTGDYLSGRKQLANSQHYRKSTDSIISLRGCRGNNLQAIDVDFPLGLLCAVTGVSGSGKSSLVQETLYPALCNALQRQSIDCLPLDSLRGWQHIDECLMIDQSPVSRSPRSNPVTYIKAFDPIRKAFADTLDAKTRNFTNGHFSFNSDLGRCPTCQGDGVLQIDMQFMADVSMTCTSCNGSRYRPDVLEVRYRDRNIAEVLQLTVREAQDFFRGAPSVQECLQVLVDVGLEYLQLGQSALTLSAGEAQRLKLAGCIATSKRPRTLFVFDEPATGLHPHDITHLLHCFNRLIDAGHSIVMVEHNLHLIAAADYVIDLGPGAAELGGRIVAQGTPQEIVARQQSITGRFLASFQAPGRS